MTIMAGLIPGYEYDIFISYRQKDNKYDGWVTDFIDHLKRELEGTFKEEISVYFDINPQDGLLEIHEVNASLKEKLKCLVFIPIISQTYCDIKSFAWQHEFCAFNKLAKKDQFGRDIRLAGGNVTSRILPIKIHDLDPEDSALLEKELGGPLRCIELIFKSAGVNRPLNPSDNPDKNLNKTYYRDQINKVANVVKEIITAIKKHDQLPNDDRVKVAEIKPDKAKIQKPIVLIGSLLLLVLIVLGYFFLASLTKTSKPFEKSIAVLPFKNISVSLENTYFINSIMEEVLNNLQTFKDLRVISRNSVEQSRSQENPSAFEIANKLDVNYLVLGTGQKQENTIRLKVQLIDARTNRHIWAGSFEREINEAKDLFIIQSQITEAIASKMKAILTPEEKQLIEKIPTIDLNAYDLYQRGNIEYSKYQADNTNIKALETAEKLFNNALTYDSNFSKAYTALALVLKEKHQVDKHYFFTENYPDSVMILANKALFLDFHNSEAYILKGFYYLSKGTSEQAFKQFEWALKYNPNNWLAHQYQGYMYLYQNNSLDFVKSLENFHEAVRINKGKEQASLLRDLGKAYCHGAGLIEKGNSYYKEAFKVDRDSSLFNLCLADNEFLLGNINESLMFLNRAYSNNSKNSDILRGLFICYTLIDEPEKSLKYCKKYLERIEESKSSFVSYHRIGYAYWNAGYKKEGYLYFRKQIKNSEELINKGQSYVASYRLAPYYDLAGVYAFLGEKDKAYANLRVWARMPVCPFWWVVLIKKDPLFDSLRNEPEFQQILLEVEARYQSEHKRVINWLKEKGVV